MIIQDAAGETGKTSYAVIRGRRGVPAAVVSAGGMDPTPNEV